MQGQGHSLMTPEEGAQGQRSGGQHRSARAGSIAIVLAIGGRREASVFVVGGGGVDVGSLEVEIDELH